MSSLVGGGAIVQAVRSDLTLEQSVFLGSTGNSGVYNSVVQNIEWKGITVDDTVFVDYGQRPELYGKLGLAAPFSWVNIGNAAVLTSDSPRREAIFRNVFLDEGGLDRLSSLPDRFQPASAPIDLVYISGLFMNVSNLGTSGNYLSGVQRVLIENSHYGWSHNADAYVDFLNRTPDDAGLDFWSNQILSCGTDAACIADHRINVSAAFFLSIEFQQTGFLVYRLYQASFARPPRHLDEFLLDTRMIGEGVVVNTPGWEQLLEANKTEFIKTFVARPQFSESYPVNLSPTQFVNQLNSTAGGLLSPNDLALAVGEFQGAATSGDVVARARVLRRVAENETFSQRQLNPAFVLMQYFGYLQRNPSEAPDTNLDGYNFWLHKLEEFGGDFRRAEMVKAFLLSSEYRARFGAP